MQYENIDLMAFCDNSEVCLEKWSGKYASVIADVGE